MAVHCLHRFKCCCVPFSMFLNGPVPLAVSWHSVQVPVGLAIDNTVVEVLDDSLAACPRGTVSVLSTPQEAPLIASYSELSHMLLRHRYWERHGKCVLLSVLGYSGAKC